MTDYLLQHEFKNVAGLEENGGMTGISETFGKFKWRLGIINSKGYLWLSLTCERLSKDVERVKTDFKLILISENGNRWAKNFDGYCFKFNETGAHKKSERIVGWGSLKNDFLVDGKIKVQAQLGALEVEDTCTGEFTMEQVFKNVQALMPGDDVYSERQSHLNLWWKLQIRRDATSLGVCVCCKADDQKRRRKLRADLILALVSENGNRFAVTLKDACFDLISSETYNCQGKFILEWRSIGDFLDNGKMRVEAKVNVLENVGVNNVKFAEDVKTHPIKVERSRAREDDFDFIKKEVDQGMETLKEMASKVKLSNAKLEESLKSHADEADLLKFLEIRYDKAVLTDATVDVVLQFAQRKIDFVVLDKCETFLMLKSGKSISEILKIAMKFDMESLKSHCLSKITTVEQIDKVIGDLKLSGLDRPSMEALMAKALELKSKS